MIITTIDNSGRISIPKPLRDALRLAPGDTIELSEDDGEIMLRPIRRGSPLVKEMGVWVYRSGIPVSESDAERVISQARDERLDTQAQ